MCSRSDTFASPIRITEWEQKTAEKQTFSASLKRIESVWQAGFV